jgi:hypothetical protein
MSSPTCAVIPSREEGMVGMAIELLKAQIPVFATIECGLGPRETRFVLRKGEEERWADQVVSFCVERSEGDFAPCFNLDVPATTAPVRDAVTRFILTGDARPKLWVHERKESIELRRSASGGANEYGFWIEQQMQRSSRSPLVDGVLFGAQLLDCRSEVERFRVREVSHDAMPEGTGTMGSADPHQETHFAQDVEVSPTIVSVIVSTTEASRVTAGKKLQGSLLSAAMIRIYASSVAWRLRPLRRLASGVRGRLKPQGLPS